MEYKYEAYDVAVIGAGHAGCEAALACARLGLKTIIFTISVESIAMMPCNPNIGGSSKGHLVREIDALGGEMGKNIDKTFIQSKMLNSSKGPAVHSLRAQADKADYSRKMRQTLENTDNLTIKQAEIVDIIVEEGCMTGVKTHTGGIYPCKAAVLATGTYLKARCLCGETITYTGPNGLKAANDLSEALKREGIELVRFKTGTPARMDKRTIDFSKMAEQFGDETVVPFSFTTDPASVQKEQVSCWLTYTNEETHQIIRNNLDRSPIYAGIIEGTGPRYCPSIEDKVVKFADKNRHQVFLEPEGLYTNEMYVGGMSSSLPEDVQYQMYHTVPGLEHAKIVRNAYAIEYDCIPATQLKPTLEFKKISGLFSGGQFNGSSGYEEAAAQGLMAGINAAMKVLGRDQVILKRSDAYIGVLIDDIRYQHLLQKEVLIYREIERVSHVNIGAGPKTQKLLEACGSTPLKTAATLAELIRRPELNYKMLADIDEDRPELPDEVTDQVEISIKYDGYIKRQLSQVEKFKKLESKTLPEDICYSDIHGLRIEAQQKLDKIKPVSIGQASRISGVTPADISVLLIHLSQGGQKQHMQDMHNDEKPENDTHETANRE